MTISAFYAGPLLDLLLGQWWQQVGQNLINNFSTVTIGLSSTAPAQDGSNITEPSGGGYARVTLNNNGTNWALSSQSEHQPAVKSNGVSVEFPQVTASWGELNYWFAMDAADQFVVSGNLTDAPVNPVIGTSPTFNAGDLTITLE